MCCVVVCVLVTCVVVCVCLFGNGDGFKNLTAEGARVGGGEGRGGGAGGREPWAGGGLSTS